MKAQDTAAPQVAVAEMTGLAMLEVWVVQEPSVNINTIHVVCLHIKAFCENKCRTARYMAFGACWWASDAGDAYHVGASMCSRLYLHQQCKW
jgi:hypothetical protein